MVNLIDLFSGALLVFLGLFTGFALCERAYDKRDDNDKII